MCVQFFACFVVTWNYFIVVSCLAHYNSYKGQFVFVNSIISVYTIICLLNWLLLLLWVSLLSHWQTLNNKFLILNIFNTNLSECVLQTGFWFKTNNSCIGWNYRSVYYYFYYYYCCWLNNTTTNNKTIINVFTEVCVNDNACYNMAPFVGKLQQCYWKEMLTTSIRIKLTWNNPFWWSTTFLPVNPIIKS